jgi:uncharacterized repeat protein (TIGR02543 family)
LNGVAASSTQVDLSWTDNSGNESGFRIERCMGAACSSFAEVATVGSNVMVYQNTGLTPSTTYGYRVRASNATGSSSYTSVVYATTNAAPQFALTVGGLGTGAGTVSATGINCTIAAGVATGDCSESYPSGTVVTLTQTPTSGHTFAGWGGACTGLVATCQVTMSAARSVAAGFTAPTGTHLLTVTATGSGSGTVSATGINCVIVFGVLSGDCSESYTNNTVVTLTETPASGHTFTTWSGACGGTSTTCQVTMSTARTVTAGFAPPMFALTVVGSGTGSGTVTGTGIACTITSGVATGDCTESYTGGTVVALTQTPSTGHSFAGWSLACSGTATTCQVTMTAARTVSAGFTPAGTYALTVTATGTGSGAVSANGISCTITSGVATGDCSESYASGTMVTLTETPSSGHAFAGWGGACTGTATNCQVTMSTARAVSAGFTPPTHTLTVVAVGTGSGSVTGPGISCGISAGGAVGDCTETYIAGTVVTLTETPTSGYTFAGWGNACTGTATTCQVTMTAPRTVSADFSPPVVNYTLTVSATGTGSGSVSATGISCTITSGVASGDCTQSYPSGTAVTLTETPSSGHTFAGWGGACRNTATTCQVTMVVATVVSAGFTPPIVNHSLTVTATGTGSGSVSATGISCTITSGVASGDCQQSYASGTLVTFT